MRILEAVLITVVTIAGAFALTVTSGIQVAVVICVMAILLPLIVYYSPVASALMDALWGDSSILPFGVYIEIYERNEIPHISVFRHGLNADRRRSEIFGIVFQINVDPGKDSVERIGDWRSHFLNFSKKEDGVLQYFYKSSFTPEIVGITKMSLRDGADGSGAFFSDIQAKGPSSVVQFSFHRVHMDRRARTKLNEKQFDLLEADYRRARASRKNFEDSYAQNVAKLIVSGSDNLKLMFDSESFAEIDKMKSDHVARAGARRQAESRHSMTEIREALSSRRNRAYSPFSEVNVVAAVEDDFGNVFYGVNVENAAYPAGTCAEQSAISAMVTAGGPLRQISRVYLASNRQETIWPCGGCRQRIAELAAKDCEVHSLSSAGDWSSQSVKALLPLAFTLNEL